MREARTLRTLILLDLESHPPSAAIDHVMVAVDPTPGRVVQFSLLTRPLPSPEQVSTLMARLQALMGETRCGSPAVVDSWEPGAYAMAPFTPLSSCVLKPTADQASVASNVGVALRRFRFPIVARVRVEDGKPARVITDRGGMAGGRVETCSGPWRTSGAWWLESIEAHRTRWDRDEWDVTLTDGATYRIFRERGVDRWFVEGVVD
jgi:protein ImuB